MHYLSSPFIELLIDNGKCNGIRHRERTPCWMLFMAVGCFSKNSVYLKVHGGSTRWFTTGFILRQLIASIPNITSTFFAIN